MEPKERVEFDGRLSARVSSVRNGGSAVASAARPKSTGVSEMMAQLRGLNK